MEKIASKDVNWVGQQGINRMVFKESLEPTVN